MQKPRLLLLLLAIIWSLAAQAQTRQVAGRVLSAADGSPLPGATVVIKGTTQGSSTNSDGTFSLDVSQQNSVLVVSFVGYISQELNITGTEPLTVRLAESTMSLSDVVVVGYGTQKKRDITGSVASISAEQVAETPIARADQILQGRVSGVQVTQTNSEPGGDVSIRIRGSRPPRTAARCRC